MTREGDTGIPACEGALPSVSAASAPELRVVKFTGAFTGAFTEAFSNGSFSSLIHWLSAKKDPGRRLGFGEYHRGPSLFGAFRNFATNCPHIS
jgi:hypothetical protein